MNLPRSIVHAVLEMAERQGEQPALWTEANKTYSLRTWKDYALRIRQLALGLRKRNFKRGDVLVIFSQNREEWLTTEMAALALGGWVVGIDANLDLSHVEEIISHSEARWLLLENAAQYLKLQSKGLPTFNVLMEPCDLSGTTQLADIFNDGAAEDESEFWQELGKIEPDDVAKLVYGPRGSEAIKAVKLSHRNLCWTARRLLDVASVRGEEQVLLSHTSLANTTEYLCSVVGSALEGYPLFFVSTEQQLEKALRHVRPTALFLVPRAWGLIHKQFLELFEKLPWHERRTLEWARQVASRKTLMQLAEERVPMDLELQFEMAERLALRPTKARLGLERARFLFASAASMDGKLLEFFASLGLVVHEVYGQSECTGLIALNTPAETRLGTVGYPLLGVEVRLTADGEVAVRGPNVTSGYFKDELATQQLFKDGWLLTGDLGEFDEKGHLCLVGRRREFLVTSSGQKVEPGHMEEKLGQIEPLGRCMVVGEGKHELTALLTLDVASAKVWASQNEEDWDSLWRSPKLSRQIHERIEKEINANVPAHERIQRFVILPTNFSREAGEVDASGFLNRRVCELHYQSIIDTLYSPPNAGVGG